jgi:hypothetical protein
MAAIAMAAAAKRKQAQAATRKRWNIFGSTIICEPISLGVAYRPGYLPADKITNMLRNIVPKKISGANGTKYKTFPAHAPMAK